MLKIQRLVIVLGLIALPAIAEETSSSRSLQDVRADLKAHSINVIRFESSQQAVDGDFVRQPVNAAFECRYQNVLMLLERWASGKKHLLIEKMILKQTGNDSDSPLLAETTFSLFELQGGTPSLPENIKNEVWSMYNTLSQFSTLVPEEVKLSHLELIDAKVQIKGSVLNGQESGIPKIMMNLEKAEFKTTRLIETRSVDGFTIFVMEAGLLKGNERLTGSEDSVDPFVQRSVIVKD